MLIKRILLLSACIILTSCGKKTASVPDVIAWNGRDMDIFANLPVCIVWYEPNDSGWTKHKVICDPDDIRLVMQGILSPEVNDWRPSASAARTENLSLIFYQPANRNIRVIEVPFRLNGIEFWGPRGNSQSLGDFLSNGMLIRPSFWPQTDPNIAVQMQEGLRREARRLKQEAAARERHDANTP